MIFYTVIRLLIGLVLMVSPIVAQDFGGPLLADCTPGAYLIEVRVYEDPNHVTAAWNAAGGQGHVLGYTTFPQGGRPEYIVHLPKLQGQLDGMTLDTWGHELAHVVCGWWHMTHVSLVTYE